jgi:signal transduction histidine kinase
VSPHRDAAGQVAGALVMVEDITEQRAIEQRLQHAQRLEAVGQLAAGIAHEINNPMAYVRSNLSVLGGELDALEKALPKDIGGAGDEARARIRALEEQRAAALANVQRTVSIVRDLREFSHAGRGEREAVDANAQLEHAARLASARAGLGEVALEFGEIPHVAIDASQLRQVLLNLLTHAQQATGPHGRVRASTAPGAGCVLISVNDDGPPIRPEERARSFEPFALSRGASEPTLGLYVSQQIVREYDGKIEVLSNEAHGTTFVVRLPVASPEGLNE